MGQHPAEAASRHAVLLQLPASVPPHLPQSVKHTCSGRLRRRTAPIGWHDVDCHSGRLLIQSVAAHAHNAVVVVQGVRKGALL